MIRIEEQKWHELTRVLITDEGGSVQLNLYPQKEGDNETAFIYALWVDEPNRRKGVATHLMDKAEYIAKHKGHKSVILDWKSEDTPREILEWYKRRGYVVVGHYREEQYTLEKSLKDEEL